jgi:flagellar basal-body rod protein FlgB
MQKYLSDLEADLRAAGYQNDILVSTSFGGVMHLTDVVQRPIYLVKSGPAMARPSASAFVVSTTNIGHVGGTATGNTGGSRIDSTAMKYRNPEQPSLDGNSVDLDRERANFADNALRYEAALRFINGSVRNLLSAIRGD